MEESVTIQEFLTYYRQCMRLEPVDENSYSPLVLAYIGDSVYEVIIRTKVINRGSMQVNKMHKQSSELVKAGTQAELIKAIEDMLTQEEHAVFKRGAMQNQPHQPRTLLSLITAWPQEWKPW